MSLANAVAENLDTYAKPWFWLLILVLGMFAGGIGNILYRHWANGRRKLFWVEEVDSNRVVWTSSSMTYSYAYGLAKTLTKRKRELYPNCKSYFRVSPTEKD